MATVMQSWSSQNYPLVATFNKLRDVMLNSRPRRFIGNHFIGTSLSESMRQGSSIRWKERMITSATATSYGGPTASPSRVDSFQLPLEYYKILGTDIYKGEDGAEEGFITKTGVLPEEGFSAYAIETRIEILNGARNLLRDPEARKLYNQELEVARDAGIEKIVMAVDVPMDKVPGALCLLQESGEQDVVTQVGHDLLERFSGDQSGPYPEFQCDVALVTALSHIESFRTTLKMVDGARSKFLYGMSAGFEPGTFARGFRHLEAALDLLIETCGSGFAPRVREEIEAAMDLYGGRAALDILSLPIGSSERGRGVKAVGSVLWSQAGDGAEPLGDEGVQFLQEALKKMTTSEQIELHALRPDPLDPSPSERYSLALAMAARGFFDRNPTLIRSAEQQLSYLKNTGTIPGVKGGFVPEDVTLELAMCALLLGRVHSCLQILGLDTDPPRGDLSVAQFVYQRSPEASGVWWEEQVRQSRDVYTQYDSPFIAGDQAGAPSELSRVATSALLPGVCFFLKWWLEECVVPRFQDLEGADVALSHYFDDPIVLRQLDGWDRRGLAGLDSIMTVGFQAIENLRVAFGSRRGDGLEESSQQGFDDVDGELAPGASPAAVGRNRSMQEIRKRNRAAFGGAEEDENGIIERPEGPGGRQADREASKKSPWQSIVYIAAGTLLIGGLTWLTLSRPFKVLFQGAVRPAGTSQAAREEQIVLERHRKIAMETVHSWQAAKALAMGPRHLVYKLSETLDGPMLDSWRKKALTAKANDWYWEFEFLDLEVSNVNVSPDGHRATMDARITESARMFDNSIGGRSKGGKDSYRDSFTVHYDLVLTEQGWKIYDGAIIR